MKLLIPVKERTLKMENWKMFEIDDKDDLRICGSIMSEFLLQGKKI